MQSGACAVLLRKLVPSSPGVRRFVDQGQRQFRFRLDRRLIDRRAAEDRVVFHFFVIGAGGRDAGHHPVGGGAFAALAAAARQRFGIGVVPADFAAAADRRGAGRGRGRGEVFEPGGQLVDQRAFGHEELAGRGAGRALGGDVEGDFEAAHVDGAFVEGLLRDRELGFRGRFPVGRGGHRDRRDFVGFEGRRQRPGGAVRGQAVGRRDTELHGVRFAGDEFFGIEFDHIFAADDRGVLDQPRDPAGGRVRPARHRRRFGQARGEFERDPDRRVFAAARRFDSRAGEVDRVLGRRAGVLRQAVRPDDRDRGRAAGRLRVRHAEREHRRHRQEARVRKAGRSMDPRSAFRSLRFLSVEVGPRGGGDPPVEPE